MNSWTERDVKINGHQLTEAQSMTFRVSASFVTESRVKDPAPRITVNDFALSESLAARRIEALQRFAEDLSLNGLGGDSHGRTMTGLYLKRLEEIAAFLKGSF